VDRQGGCHNYLDPRHSDRVRKLLEKNLTAEPRGRSSAGSSFRIRWVRMGGITDGSQEVVGSEKGIAGLRAEEEGQDAAADGEVLAELER
jgi:hypothetical protein